MNTLKGIILIFIFSIVNSYAQNNYLDTNFGRNGKAISPSISPKNHAWCVAMAVQNDGKIILAGKANNYNWKNCIGVIRYLPNGEVDKSFGNKGVLLDSTMENESAVPNSMVIQNDNKIVIAGKLEDKEYKNKIFLRRYDSNGKIDETWGEQGKVTYSFSDSFNEWPIIAMQRDGKIVLASTSRNSMNDKSFISLTRLDANGSIDKNFGINGQTQITFDKELNNIYSIKILPNEDIVLSGSSSDSNKMGEQDLTICKINNKGNLDASFGKGGKILFHKSGYALNKTEVMLNSLNNFIVKSAAENTVTKRKGILIIKYDLSGTLDTTFADKGVSIINSPKYDITPNCAVMQQDNKMIIGGDYTDHSKSKTLNLYFTKIDENGSIDKSFGNKGEVIPSGGSDNNSISALAIPLNGKILAAGTSNNVSDKVEVNYVLLRLLK